MQRGVNIYGVAIALAGRCPEPVEGSVTRRRLVGTRRRSRTGGEQEPLKHLRPAVLAARALCLDVTILSRRPEMYGLGGYETADMGRIVVEL
ncbi:MAG: hypothetical protein HY328_01865 [Chloroflexi bacterium]|nr:hypothetical protein [Chloroflexota bacterium]